MNLADNVIPISQPHGSGNWVDVDVHLPPRRPRITPGRYQARSAALVRRDAFRRETLELVFDVFDGPATDGVLLAHGVPMFIRLLGRRGLSPQSKLAQLLYVAGLNPKRSTKVNLAVLRDKLWEVQVVDTAHDADGQPMTAEHGAYSVIKRVLSRLA